MKLIIVSTSLYINLSGLHSHKVLQTSEFNSEIDEIKQYFTHLYSTESTTLVQHTQSNKDNRILLEKKGSPRIIKFHQWSELNGRLEVRYDNMNKNFIRAVKREYTKTFYDFLENKGLNNIPTSLSK